MHVLPTLAILLSSPHTKGSQFCDSFAFFFSRNRDITHPHIQLCPPSSHHLCTSTHPAAPAAAGDQYLSLWEQVIQPVPLQRGCYCFFHLFEVVLLPPLAWEPLLWHTGLSASNVKQQNRLISYSGATVMAAPSTKPSTSGDTARHERTGCARLPRLRGLGRLHSNGRLQEEQTRSQEAAALFPTV